MPSDPRVTPVDPPSPLAPGRPGLGVFAGVMLAIFLGALDQTIVAVSLSAIAVQLGDFHALPWVISGYLMAMTASTPLYGKLGDLFGRRRLLLVSLALFTGASCLCALAQAMWQLVLFRIVQGLGAGGLMTLAQAVIGDVLPPRERGRYQGYISGTFALASVLGPLLGGLIATSFSWRWVFWINLPLGLLALWICRRSLPATARRERVAIDARGALSMVAALICLLLALGSLARGGSAWTTVWPWLLLLAAGGSLYAFVRTERQVAEPLLPLELFASPGLRYGALIGLSANVHAIALSALVPLGLQRVRGIGLGEAALLLLPLVLGVPLGAFVCGRLISRWGRYRPQALFGALLLPLAIAALGLLRFAELPAVLACLLACGVGVGSQFPTSLVACQAAVARDHLGVATSTAVLLRTLGGALGMALLSSLLQLLLAGDGGLDHASSPATSDAFETLLLIEAALAAPGFVAALRLPARRLDDTAAQPAET